MTEKREREWLDASNAQLRAGEHPAAPALREAKADLAKAFVLDTIPGQDEEEFTILLGERQVVELEVSRDGKSRILRTIPVEQYRPAGRSGRLRLAVALSLAREKGSGD